MVELCLSMQVWNIILLLPHSIAIVLAYPELILKQGNQSCSSALNTALSGTPASGMGQIFGPKALA